MVYILLLILLFETRVSCPVGENFYDIKDFKLTKNNIYIHFYKKIMSTSTPKTEHKYFYDIISWNKEIIVLKKLEQKNESTFHFR